MSAKILEIACFSLESARIAQLAGANRIELCNNYEAGGYSPSVTDMIKARKLIQIPLHVMVRPNPALFKNPALHGPETFCYSEMELQWMLQYIMACRVSGIDGIVFGALSPEKEIDVTACSRLMEAAGSLSLTFHRAIDVCPDSEAAIRVLISLGVHRVLSSGGAPTAMAGLNQLTRLQANYGHQIRLMPGGGIRSANIEILLQSGCTEFHSAALNPSTGAVDAAEIQSLKKFVI